MTDTRHLTHISDTARWIAVMRARETERPDALFRDPLAAKVTAVRAMGVALGKAPEPAGHAR